MQAVVSGQAVPVLSRGIITLDNGEAFTTAPTSVGQGVYASDTEGGKLKADTIGSANQLGKVIATGNRVNRGVSPDYFAGPSVGTGAATTDGAYSVVQLNCQ